MTAKEEVDNQIIFLKTKYKEFGIESISDKDIFILSNLLYKRDYKSEPTLEGLTMQRGIDWGMKLMRQIVADY